MQKLKYIAAVLLVCVAAGTARAQTPAPAPAQQKPVLLLNGTAHLGNGEVIENAAIAFENGELTLVSDARNIRLDMDNFEVINIEGKHVYPGLILPCTDLGLVEIEAVRATVDNNETGMLNPNVRSLIAFNTDSEMLPTMRHNGILIAQTTPVGGLIPGTSSVVQLDAWNWEDAAMKEDVAIHMNMPNFFSYSGWWAEPGTIKRNENYDKFLDMLREFLTEAKGYAEMDKPGKANLKLEAMRGLFDGSKKLFIQANYMKEIIDGITLAKEAGVKEIVLFGGEESWQVKEFLKEHKIPVVLGQLHRLPNTPEQDVDLPYRLPAMLTEEGITVGLAYSAGMTQNARNLAFLAGTAAAYGMDKEEALKLVTLNNARILGIDDKAGSLEVGKDATLVVSGGDLLDMRTSQVEHAFIQGRKVTTEAMQERLYDKFKEKYSRD